jgi:hypothetical protein
MTHIPGQFQFYNHRFDCGPDPAVVVRLSVARHKGRNLNLTTRTSALFHSCRPPARVPRSGSGETRAHNEL